MAESMYTVAWEAGSIVVGGMSRALDMGNWVKIVAGKKGFDVFVEVGFGIEAENRWVDTCLGVSVGLCWQKPGFGVLKVANLACVKSWVGSNWEWR